MTAEYIPALTLAASVAVPFLVEVAKKRFGAQSEARTAAHTQHAEIMAELAAERLESAGLKTLLLAAEARAREGEERAIGLLKENAAKDLLIGTLTANWTDTTKTDTTKERV